MVTVTKEWLENTRNVFIEAIKEDTAKEVKYEPLILSKYIDAIDKYTSKNFDKHFEEGSRVIAANDISGFINEIILIYIGSKKKE